MKKLFIILMFFGNLANAQTNLVPNWSFEEYNSCPTLGTETCPISQVLMPSLKNWFCAMDFESTPDFNNVCSTNILNKVPTSLYAAQEVALIIIQHPHKLCN